MFSLGHLIQELANLILSDLRANRFVFQEDFRDGLGNLNCQTRIVEEVQEEIDVVQQHGLILRVVFAELQSKSSLSLQTK